MYCQYSKHLLQLIVFVICIFSLLPSSDLQQHGYTIKHDYVLLSNISRKFLEYARVENVWYNRTTRDFDAFFKNKVAVTSSLNVEFKQFIYLSNQYKSFAPMHLTLNICQMLDRNLFGMKDAALKSSNITHCPIAPGAYYIKSLTVNVESLPPYIPPGKYRSELTFRLNNSLVFIVNWYGHVIQRIF